METDERFEYSRTQREVVVAGAGRAKDVFRSLERLCGMQNNRMSLGDIVLHGQKMIVEGARWELTPVDISTQP